MEKVLDKLSINYEMIIAEDGSTDNTKEVLNTLLKIKKNLYQI